MTREEKREIEFLNLGRNCNLQIAVGKERSHADRLIDFQSGEFACDENQIALEYTLSALTVLQMRTELRRARGVEGKTVK